MYKKTLTLVSIFLFIFSSLVFSEENNISVSKMVFCQEVEELQPIKIDSTFADTVDKVYCFTKIKGAQDTIEITHVWSRKGEEMARVPLSVKSSSWRTWSSKQMLESWTGQWRVDVISPEGDVLKSKSFEIKK
ncbi:MAG: DUF2914 domain-containing protein [Candidatus Marinimicrobia bacterium]|nr:DUF2914 domain-containing protein [Candidatus Neomarinimicrobiota bacterium]